MFDETLKKKIDLKLVDSAPEHQSPVNEVALDNSAEELKQLALSLPEQFLPLSVIGQGGMGTVFKCRNKYTDRVVAIKMLHGKCDPLTEKRFQQEAKAAAALQHENAVTIYDFGITSGGNPYLVMENLEGESLATTIQKHGVIEEELVARIFIEACGAIECAHKLGVIHRDIKPSNLMLMKDKDALLTVKVLDFGIAKVASDDPNQALTKTGELFGSPLYMSPEQCKGINTDLRSDIYSLGVSMFECLTGRVPHAGDNAIQTMFKRATEEVPAFKTIRPDLEISPQIENIVMHALERERSVRYQTVTALKNELEHYLEQSKPSRCRTLSAPAHLPIQNKRLVWLCASTFALVLVIVASAALHTKPTTLPESVTSTPVAQPRLELEDDLSTKKDEATALLLTKNYPASIKKFKKLILLAEAAKPKPTSLLYFAYQNMALAYAGLNERDDEKDALRNAIKYATGTTELALLNYRIGFSNFVTGNYDQALPAYMEALKYTEKDGLHVQAALIYNDLSYIYLMQNQYEECKKACTSLISEMKFVPRPNLYTGVAYERRGECYFKQKKYRNAIADFERAIQLLAVPELGGVAKRDLASARRLLELAKKAHQ